MYVLTGLMSESGNRCADRQGGQVMRKGRKGVTAGQEGVAGSEMTGELGAGKTDQIGCVTAYCFTLKALYVLKILVINDTADC